MPLLLRRVSPRTKSVSRGSFSSAGSFSEGEQLDGDEEQALRFVSEEEDDDNPKPSSSKWFEMRRPFMGTTAMLCALVVLVVFLLCSLAVATDCNDSQSQATAVHNHHVPVQVEVKYNGIYHDQNENDEKIEGIAFVQESVEEHRQESLPPTAAPAATTSTNHMESNNVNRAPVPDQPECRLYLAPSTIPNSGMGIFTAVPISAGEIVGDDDVALPLLETHFFNNHESQPDSNPVFNPFVNYYWKGQEMGMHRLVSDERAEDVQAYIPGMDSAANCNLALLNVAKSNVKFDDSQLQRSKHAMAGAMTPYHSTQTIATKPLPAGGEVFKFYGDRWFTARSDIFGASIPLSEDYPAAEKVVQKFDALRTNYFVGNNDLAQDLFFLAKGFIGTEMWASPVINAMPTTLGDAIHAAHNGIGSLHQPHATRSLEFLQTFGKCVDHIQPGPSTLPQAGRGAFARRMLPKGTILSGSPLLHVPRKDLLNMYRMEQISEILNSTDKQEISWLRHEVVGQQIVINYCFTDEMEKSTLLLCPYSSGVNYINHNQTKANVKIQWAEDGITRHNAAWLSQKRVEDLEWEYSVGLAFDYVATRDIVEGEELFLDYGESFELALNDHLENWQPPKAFDDESIPAERYNDKFAEFVIKTEEEQNQEPYPANLELRCHHGLYQRTRPASNSSKLGGSNTSTEYKWEIRDEGYPCRILERHDHDESLDLVTNNNIDEYTPARSGDSATYKVEIKIPLSHLELPMSKEGFTYIRRNKVPRTAILFFNTPYTTDLQQPKVFRKPIGIPADIFPDHWRNLAKPA